MQPEPLRVGLIEDDTIMGEAIVQRLALEGCSVDWWTSGREALGSAALDTADIVVCDIRLPDMTGEDIYREKLDAGHAPPFLFVTGFGEIDQAVRLMRLGASDYLLKPFVFDEFLLRVRDNARKSRDGEPSGLLRLGVSAQMRAAERLLDRYAPNDLPVLITGETGVGKEVTARLLHKRSPFAQGPFVAVNCAAIPADLLESEIFGHERGAFTGAERQHLGYAERTQGGTLFLDEIGDMPLALQAKILRLVEDRSFYRIGGERPIPFRGRIVAATHRDLIEASRARDFREDLYYRLAVLTLELPPLRKRPEDIVRFMGLFLEEACRSQNRTFKGFSSMAEELALGHPWRGNLRELRNRVERAVAVGNQERILPQDMFPDRAEPSPVAEGFVPLSGVRDEAERRHIERALDASGGQVTEAARLLGISRTTLWEKMTRLGIPSPRSES
ncbi:sigma-54-dependent transcriptional regulator [Polymorphum gilvum]|uniref:Nif-specific regulatory protein n=1 Tax=Polymorphum gilvum (strain LMG 25793 / CGMCC 1.9160 / SL003B-26A1) TaxID=991905 RepID=F2J0S4_POLGS|nr:sigma-54 dependent transcriptional regulator [Polymorphum gilvum]ADZ70760.1 Two component, sigma54 specific, transcriptional regulator, Fis family [Polymorphum gilvum SL003B-26A1]